MIINITDFQKPKNGIRPYPCALTYMVQKQRLHLPYAHIELQSDFVVVLALLGIPLV